VIERERRERDRRRT